VKNVDAKTLEAMRLWPLYRAELFEKLGFGKASVPQTGFSIWMSLEPFQI